MSPTTPLTPLAKKRSGFATRLTRREREDASPPLPLNGIFRLVRYPGPLGGGMVALVGPLQPVEEGLRPAVVWLPPEFAYGVNDAMSEGETDAALFSDAGLQVMIPSTRGGNDSPGVREAFLGEVDDVLAAADRLARSRGVDPERIYLVGHSTGATLALLTAECSARFRAVFAFGPVDEIDRYEQPELPFHADDPAEAEVRSPGRWLGCLQTPTYIMEGAHKSNHTCVERIAATAAATNDLVKTFIVPHADHFSLVEPACRLIAHKIREEWKHGTPLELTQAELEAAVRPRAE